MQSFFRAVKGITKSRVTNLAREATKNEPQAATTSQLMELANFTFSKEGMEYHDLRETVLKRLSHYECPQHVYKALIVVKYLLLNGDPIFINDMKKSTILHELIDYHFYSNSEEIGGNVRENANEVLRLLSNNESMRIERQKARASLKEIVGFTAQELYDTPSNGTGGGRRFTEFSSVTPPKNQKQLQQQPQPKQQQQQPQPEQPQQQQPPEQQQPPPAVYPQAQGVSDATQPPTHPQTPPQDSPGDMGGDARLAPLALTPHQSKQHGWDHEQGFVDAYGKVNPKTVSTPREKINHAEDVDLGNDIQGDMFLMCSPANSKQPSWDPFAGSQLFTEQPKVGTVMEEDPFALADFDNVMGTQQSQPQGRAQQQQQFQQQRPPMSEYQSSRPSASSTALPIASAADPFSAKSPPLRYSRQTSRGVAPTLPNTMLGPNLPTSAIPNLPINALSPPIATSALSPPLQPTRTQDDYKDDRSAKSESWDQFSPMKRTTQTQSFFQQQEAQNQQQQQVQTNMARTGSTGIDHFTNLMGPVPPQKVMPQPQPQPEVYDVFANLPHAENNPFMIQQVTNPQQQHNQQRVRSSDTIFSPAQLQPAISPTQRPHNPLDDLPLPQ